jgi:hypothetical protein
MQKILMIFLILVCDLINTTLISSPSDLVTNQNAWDSLRGTWRKESFKIKDSIGNWSEFEWHKGGDLYLIYDGLGGAALHSTPADYQLFFSKSNFNNSNTNRTNIDSLKYLAENYTYFARCEIYNDTIFHKKITHTNPNEIGEIVKRKYRLINDTLYLTPLNFKSEVILKLIRVK